VTLKFQSSANLTINYDCAQKCWICIKTNRLEQNDTGYAMACLYLVHASGIARLWINLKSFTNNKKSIC